MLGEKDQLQMKILMLYPKYPNTFWSFKKVLNYIKKKAVFPPLGLLTIGSMLPGEWEKKLVDLNVTNLKTRDIMWADMIFVSAMIVQKDNAQAIITYPQLTKLLSYYLQSGSGNLSVNRG